MAWHRSKSRNFIFEKELTQLSENATQCVDDAAFGVTHGKAMAGPAYIAALQHVKRTPVHSNQLYSAALHSCLRIVA